MTALPRLSAPQVLRSLPNDLHVKRGRELADELERRERAARYMTPTDGDDRNG